ncbi:hypothetical protein L596_009379 [Steinernema carpocapsae]|uniref:Farnesyl pyrophosphate synthase n=1 Tax=Steinernema carpocapsae TaxID=34508 RepID=A0A4U5PFL3_STECR|nr:hypothetical protein L596_009379 [Steinernema carpocapsae]
MATRAAIERALIDMKRLVASRMTVDMAGADAERSRAHIENLIDSTVLGGKCERSRLLVDTYMSLEPKGNFSAAVQLSTSMELLQSFFLVIDDVMDQSVTRRGKPCWYRQPGIGLSAINDGLLLDCTVDLMIRNAIPENPNLNSILAALAEVKRKTVIGQLIDSSIQGYADCNWTRYSQLVEHKTSHYTYFSPIQIALLLANIPDHMAEVRKICYDIGYLFQSQDDYLDVFGDEKVTGKVGTDLKEGKCTWVTCKTFEKVPAEETKVLKEIFGRSDDGSVEELRRVIRGLKVEKEFQKFQEEFVEDLQKRISEFPLVKLRPSLEDAVKRIINRKK